ncbi:MAG: hypothetical protein KBC56_02670 [Flavobacterium sp.]|nr:hypothetical protein [Flavobacterium sp.]
MEKEVFTWKMSAEQHKSSIYALRDEIVYHYEEQKPFSIVTLMSLLPLNTDNIELILSRGDIDINGNDFSNIGNELWIEFYDEVLGNYYATLPANWLGKLSINDEIIEIEFQDGILLEIPEIANLGVDRSSFQKLVKIKSTKNTTISVLIDNETDNKITWIDAVLEKNTLTSDYYPDEKLKSLEIFDTSSNGCGNDPDDPNWYVYERIRDGICVVHYGQVITGGSIAYIYRYGPTTQRDCETYASQNCNYNLK